MKAITTLAIFGSTTTYGFFASLGNFSSETTQIAFKLQDIAQHAETISEWERNYEQITNQLETMTEQLDIQTTVRDWIGDPTEVDLPSIDILTAEDFLESLDFGIPWDDIIGTADGTDSLDETHNDLFEKIEPTTVTGEAVAVTDSELKKYAAVDLQYTNYVDASENVEARLLELQENQALTLVELENADTDAEVQKLSAIVNAQNGQIALLISEREKQYQQYNALKQLNENQAEKTKSVSIKAQLKDQNDAFQSLQTYLENLTELETD